MGAYNSIVQRHKIFEPAPFPQVKKKRRRGILQDIPHFVDSQLGDRELIRLEDRKYEA